MKGQAMTLREYAEAVERRNAIISENKRRRILGRPRLAVPARPIRPTVPIAYDADGTYVGRLVSAADCPAGCVVKWETQAW